MSIDNELKKLYIVLEGYFTGSIIYRMNCPFTLWGLDAGAAQELHDLNPVEGLEILGRYMPWVLEKIPLKQMS
jgi:hypothetical protein